MLAVTHLRRFHASFDHIEEVGRKTTLTKAISQCSNFPFVYAVGSCQHSRKDSRGVLRQAQLGGRSLFYSPKCN
jgi:hypothetical protein